MSARLLLGTASWSDKPLIDCGRFYPPEAKSAEDRLRYYASQFPMVEADTTYYGLPTLDTSKRWVERTPPGFIFDVKAYSLFTEHPTPVARLPKAMQETLPPVLVGKRQFYREQAPPDFVDLCWSTFNDALLPLHDAGKLGVVLFQFPKWVTPGANAFRYLEEIRERLGHYRGAVEFRNALWLDAEHREQTLALLGDCDLSYVCVDEPQGFPSSVPPVVVATNRLACVRFHGRNARMWEERTQTASERFDYYYQPSEMDEWVPRIASLATESDELHVVMNTNNFDQGPVNARLLEERLGEAGIEVVRAPHATPEPAAETGKQQGRLL
ncbi:MAG: DUF72 domain-containing protein [Dehalococcoidia bacterium]